MENFQYTGLDAERNLKIVDILSELSILNRYKDQTEYELKMWGNDLGEDFRKFLSLKQDRFIKRHEELIEMLKSLGYIM